MGFGLCVFCVQAVVPLLCCCWQDLEHFEADVAALLLEPEVPEKDVPSDETYFWIAKWVLLIVVVALPCVPCCRAPSAGSGTEISKSMSVH